MAENIYSQIINEIAPYKTALRFSRWGEPTLHKKFYEYMTIAKNNGIMCHLNTNGSLLNSEGINRLLDLKLDSIKFSFQGTDEKTYGEMRYGQSFNKLYETVKLFYELRGNLPYPYMHASTTITYETPEMVVAFKEKLSPYCDLVTVGHTMLSHISAEMTNLPKEAKKLLRILKEKESIEKVYKLCNEIYDKLSINWDGTVSACCVDYDNFMIVGDLNESSLQDIWKNSEKLKEYREMLNENRHAEMSLCKHCYDTMNLRANIPALSTH